MNLTTWRRTHTHNKSFKNRMNHRYNHRVLHSCGNRWRQVPCVTKQTQSQNSKHNKQVDVVVLGAGIIGLLTADALLKKGLSVALVEKNQLCAGATGAGQGYIWMAHRNPTNPAWSLASQSITEWHHMLQSDPDLRECIEWQETGSILLATSAEEAESLRTRQSLLETYGIQSLYLDGNQLVALEPALRRKGNVIVQGALRTSSDTQISGRKAAHKILSRCQSHSGLTLLMEEPVERLLNQPFSSCPSGVETENHIIGGRLGTVVAAGVWSGELLAAATGQHHWSKALQPRRGHLLELISPQDMPQIQNGIMEMSYTKHYDSKFGMHEDDNRSDDKDDLKTDVDITFTATTSASGTLLIGSSREFSGWSSLPSEDIVKAIMDRAAQFLPHLEGLPLPNGENVRVGLRPYASRGLPIVGPVPGFPGLIVAAGHEGSGLCLGPATAQLVCQYLTGESRLGPSQSLMHDLIP